MSSGAYIALSGMQSRTEQLNRLAEDIANIGTAGYKTERSTTAAAERPPDPFGRALQSAIDVTDGPRTVDFRNGTIAPTGRDLDLAIDGKGFFVIDTPDGQRYTRNGHFTRAADGTITTQEGYPLVGENGPLKLPADGSKVTVGEDGQIAAGATSIGRAQVVEMTTTEGVAREDGGRFRVANGVAVRPATDARVVNGALEQANVSVVERVAQLTEVSRTFEALQRGVTIIMNDVDGRAITELGRR